MRLWICLQQGNQHIKVLGALEQHAHRHGACRCTTFRELRRLRQRERVVARQGAVVRPG